MVPKPDEILTNLKEWLGNFTYKPQYRFEIVRTGIKYYVRGVKDTEDGLKLTGDQLIPREILYLNDTHDCELAFYGLMRVYVDQLETFESDRWFKINGFYAVQPGTRHHIAICPTIPIPPREDNSKKRFALKAKYREVKFTTK